MKIIFIMKKVGLASLLLGFAACSSSVEVPQQPPQEDGGVPAVDCTDSVEWVQPVYSEELDSSSDAPGTAGDFIMQCDLYNTVAVENNEICKGNLPQQMAGVFCHDVETQLQQVNWNCASMKADGGSAFAAWIKGLPGPVSCIVAFTQAMP